MTKQVIKCPYCRESFYQEVYKTSTCMAYGPIYKNGNIVSEDPNVTSITCHCMSCDKDFVWSSKGEK